MSHADVNFSNFSGANLSHASLLSATNFGSANFFNAVWFSTICPDGTGSNLHVHGCFSLLLDSVKLMIDGAEGKIALHYGSPVIVKSTGLPLSDRDDAILDKQERLICTITLPRTSCKATMMSGDLSDPRVVLGRLEIRGRISILEHRDTCDGASKEPLRDLLQFGRRVFTTSVTLTNCSPATRRRTCRRRRTQSISETVRDALGLKLPSSQTTTISGHLTNSRSGFVP